MNENNSDKESNILRNTIRGVAATILTVVFLKQAGHNVLDSVKTIEANKEDTTLVAWVDPSPVSE